MSDNKLRSVTHVIFDLDGLIIDTEMWGFKYLNVLLESYGKQCSLQLYSRQVGVSSSRRAQRLIDELKLECDAQQFLNDWIQECMKHTDDIQLMPGVKRLIEHLHKHNIPLAIATSGKKVECYPMIKHLGDIFEDGKFFNHVVYGDDSQVKHLKPHPDLYQICASKFSPVPDPQNVLAFEDSIAGISAATAAGMQSVLVWNKRFGECVDSNATLVINSLEEFKPELFGLPTFESII